MTLKQLTVFIVSLIALTCNAETKRIEAKVKHPVQFKTETGALQKPIDISFVSGECEYSGIAMLDSGRHRADVEIRVKKCGEITQNAKSLVIDLSGHPSLEVNCTKSFTNKLKNNVCTEGTVKSGVIVELIDY